MTLEEFADIINVDINLTRYANQDNRWCASFESAEIMRGGCLLSTYGDGTTPQEAISEYTEIIAGQKIAVGAYTDNRREYTVPKNIGE